MMCNPLKEIGNLLTENAIVYVDNIDNVITIIDCTEQPALTMEYEEALVYFYNLMFTKNMHIRYNRFKSKAALEEKVGSVRSYIESGDYTGLVGV